MLTLGNFFIACLLTVSYHRGMKKSNICGLDRNALTEAGVVRSCISLSTLRTDAKASGLARVIAHSSDPSRVIIVWPTGSVWGTSGEPMGWVDAIAYAASRGEYTERVGEVMA